MQSNVGIVGLAAGRLPKSFAAAPLWSEPTAAFVAPRPSLCPGFVDQARRPTRSHLVVDFASGSEARVQTDQAFAESQVPRGKTLEANSVDLICSLTANGLGVGLLPQSMSALHPELVCIPITDAPHRIVHAITEPTHSSALAREFVELLAAQFAT